MADPRIIQYAQEMIRDFETGFDQRHGGIPATDARLPNILQQTWTWLEPRLDDRTNITVDGNPMTDAQRDLVDRLPLENVLKATKGSMDRADFDNIKHPLEAVLNGKAKKPYDDPRKFNHPHQSRIPLAYCRRMQDGDAIYQGDDVELRKLRRAHRTIEKRMTIATAQAREQLQDALFRQSNYEAVMRQPDTDERRRQDAGDKAIATKVRRIRNAMQAGQNIPDEDRYFYDYQSRRTPAQKRRRKQRALWRKYEELVEDYAGLADTVRAYSTERIKKGTKAKAFMEGIEPAEDYLNQAYRDNNETGSYAKFDPDIRWRMCRDGFELEVADKREKVAKYALMAATLKYMRLNQTSLQSGNEEELFTLDDRELIGTFGGATDDSDLRERFARLYPWAFQDPTQASWDEIYDVAGESALTMYDRLHDGGYTKT